MNLRRLATAVAVCLVVLVGIVGCPKKPPETPGKPVGPDSTWQQGSTPFKFYTTAPGNKDVRYIVNWGDETDTSGAYPSGDSATIFHSWAATGDYSISAMAVLDENTALGSDWSEAAAVKVLPNSAPNPPTFVNPPLVAVVDVYTHFWATTTDPDSDSVAFNFDFNNDWTAYVPSGGVARDSNKWSRMDTVEIKVRAKDIHGAPSDWSDPLTLVIGEAGAVIWWWWADDEDEEPALTSPVIALDDGDELCYTSADFPNKVYGIDVSSGRTRKSGTPVDPLEENVFTGQPAFCAQFGHLIIGNEDGELYAFTTSLSRVWNWPDSSGYGLTYIEWGAPAVNGSKIYCPRDNDSLYYLTDLGDDPRFEAAYYIPGMIDAPVIDNQGNVLIGTDSGYLYKMLPDLSAPVWRVLLSAGDDVHSPVIGSDGTIYCGTGTGKFFAVNPDSTQKWTKSLTGEAYRAVIGASAVFVITDYGNLYSLNPANGGQNWMKTLSTDMATSPVLAGTDYIYVQDYDDILYCVQQADGAVVWQCDCPTYGPGKKRTRGRGKLDFIDPQPTITYAGNILVCGVEALYCVAGYDERPLAGTPWPKWQHDHYNTGKVTAWTW